MQLETLAKDPGSGDGGCWSVHLDHSDGHFVAQGTQVSNSELPDYLEGEAGVKISPEIVIEALKHYRANGTL